MSSLQPTDRATWHFRLIAVALPVLLAVATTSEARECGDNVGGVRVPCACGDTVISDTILASSDPVVNGRCLNGGLTIRANGLAETITLDLHGLALVGSGVGDGISVVAGGSDGAVLRGGTHDKPGEVVAFGTGIDVRSASAAKRIEAFRLDGHRHEGLMLRVAGTLVLDVTADKNGGDGLRVIGQGGRLLGVSASDNAGAGIRVNSRYTVVEARCEKNHRNDIVVSGARNDLSRSVANGNKGYGIVRSGPGHVIDGVVTDANSVGGIAFARERTRR